MAGRVAGKVALVTGAGSGIGKAMALLLAAEGAKLVVADFNGSETETAREIGGYAIAVRADVSDPVQVDAMVQAAVARFGRLDIVCNNAGRSGGVMPLHATPLDHFDAVIATNLRGAFVVLQKSIEQMLKNGGGSIVNTSSVAAILASPGTASYTAAKGGLMSMTRVAAIDYAEQNIRVNAIMPGVIATPMVAAAPQATKDRLAAMIPVKRMGTSEEMARVALFLASDDASYITGIGIAADGGLSAI
jgi:NAD(P)-dependent dehydrogenase (short-subunit alcohol dehydrogenase family)